MSQPPANNLASLGGLKTLPNPSEDKRAIIGKIKTEIEVPKVSVNNMTEFKDLLKKNQPLQDGYDEFCKKLQYIEYTGNGFINPNVDSEYEVDADDLFTECPIIQDIRKTCGTKDAHISANLTHYMGCAIYLALYIFPCKKETHDYHNEFLKFNHKNKTYRYCSYIGQTTMSIEERWQGSKYLGHLEEAFLFLKGYKQQAKLSEALLAKCLKKENVDSHVYLLPLLLVRFQGHVQPLQNELQNFIHNERWVDAKKAADKISNEINNPTIITKDQAETLAKKKELIDKEKADMKKRGDIVDRLDVLEKKLIKDYRLFETIAGANMHEGGPLKKK